METAVDSNAIGVLSSTNGIAEVAVVIIPAESTRAEGRRVQCKGMFCLLRKRKLEYTIEASSPTMAQAAADIGPRPYMRPAAASGRLILRARLLFRLLIVSARAVAAIVGESRRKRRDVATANTERIEPVPAYLAP